MWHMSHYCSFKIGNKTCRQVANQVIFRSKEYIVARCSNHEYTGDYISKGSPCNNCNRGIIRIRMHVNNGLCPDCNGKGHL